MGIQIYRRHGHEEKIREIKIEMCMLIRRAALTRKWTQKHMAAVLGASEQSVSFVVRANVDRVSFNQLFNYIVCIDPHFTMLISLNPHISGVICDRQHTPW